MKTKSDHSNSIYAELVREAGVNRNRGRPSRFPHARHEIGWYNREANQYGEDINPTLRMEFLNAISKLTDGLTLDVACGKGRFSQLLPAEVVGIDASFKMLGYARDKGIQVVCSLAEALPFRGDVFDCVVSMSALGEHLPLTSGLIEEVGRAAKARAKFIFTVIPHRPLITILIRKLLAAAGYRVAYSLSTYSASEERIRSLVRAERIVRIDSQITHLFVVAELLPK